MENIKLFESFVNEIYKPKKHDRKIERELKGLNTLKEKTKDPKALSAISSAISYIKSYKTIANPNDLKDLRNKHLTKMKELNKDAKPKNKELYVAVATYALILSTFK